MKAVLPYNVRYGILRVYAGKRGLMYKTQQNPHPLAFALLISHTGNNQSYQFVLRHPTPHATRHDLYVMQPQCARLVIHSTFVFAIRQHSSSINSCSSERRSASPDSDLSSDGWRQQQQRPAKLAIQSPGGKIFRLANKSENFIRSDPSRDGSVWELIIKVGEKGPRRYIRATGYFTYTVNDTETKETEIENFRASCGSSGFRG